MSVFVNCGDGVMGGCRVGGWGEGGWVWIGRNGGPGRGGYYGNNASLQKIVGGLCSVHLQLHPDVQQKYKMLVYDGVQLG